MLDRRLKTILRAIVQSHIDLNLPIGSFLITKRYQLGLSPATVRNIMSNLEKMGYIMQPHTSAGRIPTEKGYRFYVDNLLAESSFSINESLTKKLSENLCNPEKDNNYIIKEAARTLSLMSQHLAIVIPPRTEDMTIKHIKFIKYDTKKTLAVIISEDGSVKNIFIEMDSSYSQDQLDRAANYLNSRFRGLRVAEMKKSIILQLNRKKDTYNNLIISMLHFFRDTIETVEDTIIHNSLCGTSYLPDFVDIKQIKEILSVIEDKHFILKLLEQISGAHGIKVVIGMETITPAMKELSMVISTYNDRKFSCGAVGIIGPTRMNYRKLIPIVDYTAKTLTEILSET